MIYLLTVLTLLLFIALIVTGWHHKRLQNLLSDERAQLTKLQEDVDFYIQMMESSDEKATKLQQQLIEEVRLSEKKAKAARKDAVKRARAVAHGFSSENLAPLIINQWDPKDYRHMGDPIDYLVIAGMDKIRQNKAGTPIEEIILLDIKTGKSQLNTIQRRIRDAVVNQQVRFAIYNTDTHKLQTWPPYPSEPSKQQEFPYGRKYKKKNQ